MRNVLLLMFFTLTVCVSGCGFSEYRAKEDTRKKAIVQAVMDSESVMPGTRMVDALSVVLVASGKYVQVNGWECNKNLKDSSYDVWLNLVVNDNFEKLHWVVDQDNNMSPANDLTQKISVRQKLKI